MRDYSKRSSYSIRSQLIWTFSAMLVLEMLAFGITSSILFDRTLKENNNNYVSQMIFQMNGIIDNYISYMEDITSVVMQHEDVKDYISSTGDSSVRKALKPGIQGFLFSIKEIRKDLVNLILLFEDGDFISSNPEDRLNETFDFRHENWYLNAGLPFQKPYITSSHVQNLIKGRYPWVISISRSFHNQGEKEGILLLDLNYDVIQELISDVEIGEKGYLFIINPQGEIVYHPRQDLIYNDLKHEKIDPILAMKKGSLLSRVDDEDILYTFGSSADTGWTIVGVSNVKELLSGRRELQNFLWVLTLLTFTIVILISTLLSGRIVKPIESLRKSMQQVEKGNFDIKIDVQCDHEVYDLAEDCNIAIRKIKDLMLQNEQEQELKRKNEFKALQAQINPHFLYNTLDSIIWLIEDNENEDAVRMTEELADFFRLSLNKGREIIPIRQVIEHISSYLVIQQMRYKNKMDYRILVDPELYSYYSLKLLLQPLVENAIYHGIKNQKKEGLVVIRAVKEENCIRFSVEDSGPGIDPETLQQLRAGEIPDASRSGMGLKNVQERLHIFFGNEYDLFFESNPGKGSCIGFTIPLIKEPPQ
ncbi:MAG: sensor histidine kinase [Spirochaetales bacterium]|nr:sensor histidine kinase [Spirochaetales bacterium]